MPVERHVGGGMEGEGTLGGDEKHICSGMSRQGERAWALRLARVYTFEKEPSKLPLK